MNAQEGASWTTQEAYQVALQRRGRMCIYGLAFSAGRATLSAFVTSIESRYVPEGNYRAKPPAPDALDRLVHMLGCLLPLRSTNRRLGAS